MKRRKDEKTEQKGRKILWHVSLLIAISRQQQVEFFERSWGSLDPVLGQDSLDSNWDGNGDGGIPSWSRTLCLINVGRFAESLSMLGLSDSWLVYQLTDVVFLLILRFSPSFFLSLGRLTVNKLVLRPVKMLLLIKSHWNVLADLPAVL